MCRVFGDACDLPIVADIVLQISPLRGTMELFRSGRDDRFYRTRVFDPGEGT
jgi:hypothetical protein